MGSKEIKRLLIVVGLGLGIWGLGLFWPYVNEVLTPVTMALLILGLATISLVYVVIRDRDHDDRNGTSKKEPRASTVKLHRLNNHF